MPPPPPPGRGRARGLGAPPTPKTLLTTAVLSLTAGVLWWAALFANDPVKLGVSADGFAYATTAGGNTVLVSRDDDGRFYFVDRAGDLYYDAGAAGFYIVDPDDVIYNGYVDDEGAAHRVVVGKLSDIVTFKPEAVAGIPAQELQALVGSSRTAGKAAGLLTALDTSAVDESDPAAVLLPPNAPVGTAKDGRALTPPRLEEGMMLLEQAKGPLGGKIKADPADPLDRLAAVADRAAVLKRAYDDAVEAGVVDGSVKESVE